MDLFGFGESKEFDALDGAKLDELKALGDAARACVNTDEFRNYKKQLEASKLNILNELVLMKPKGTLEQYGMQVMIYLDRYKLLCGIVDQTIKDSKKGIDK